MAVYLINKHGVGYFVLDSEVDNLLSLGFKKAESKQKPKKSSLQNKELKQEDKVKVVEEKKIDVPAEKPLTAEEVEAIATIKESEIKDIDYFKAREFVKILNLPTKGNKKADILKALEVFKSTL